MALKTDKGKRPNILLVLTDQERARHLLPTSLPLPNHDRLAADATSFRNMSAVSNLCSLARGVTYTGQHPQLNGIWENTPLPWASGLREDIPTVGTMMQDAGYATAYFGKWHLTHLPLNETVGKQKIAEVFGSYGFEHTDQDAERDGAQAGWQHDAATATGASRFMHDMKGGDKPWFAAVNFVNPHDIMFFETDEHQKTSRLGRFPDRIMPAPDDPIYATDWQVPLPDTFGEATLAGKPDAQRQMQKVMRLALGDIPLDRRDLWASFNNYYYNCLRDMDRHLGRVLDALDESGQSGNTIVIFMADHGEMGGVHGLRSKGGNMYREDQNVPLMIRHPDVKKAREVEALASQLDIAPTLLALAGVSDAERRTAYPMLKGHDLSPVLTASGTDEGAGPRDAHLAQWTSLVHLSEETMRGFAAVQKAQGPLAKIGALDLGTALEGLHHRGHMRGVLHGNYKFARYFSPLEHNTPKTVKELTALNDLELYDIEADPMETVNLANDLEAHRPVIEKLNTRLNALIADEVGEDDGSYLPGPDIIWEA